MTDQPQNAPTADWDGYTVNERTGLCAVCEFTGPTAIGPRLTPEEKANMPNPGDPDTCTQCGMRRVKEKS